jgi:copper chaperone
MTMFSVPDMTCGHCEASIRQALGQLGGIDAIEIDRPGKRVTVTGAASADAVKAAIAGAGYTPEEIRLPA